MGAAIWDPLEGTMRTWGRVIPEELAASWLDHGRKKQLIGQAELLPAISAKAHWKKMLEGRKVIHFVDNESAREALVKGRSPSAASNLLLEEFWALEAELGSMTWFERVPSPSNCSDAPSRLEALVMRSVRVVKEHPPSIPEDVRARLCVAPEMRSGPARSSKGGKRPK